MLRLFVGIGLGFVAGYLYGSERAREETRRFVASAPEPVRQATARVSDAIDRAPLPDSVKQATARASTVVQAGTERAAHRRLPLWMRHNRARPKSSVTSVSRGGTTNLSRHPSKAPRKSSRSSLYTTLMRQGAVAERPAANGQGSEHCPNSIWSDFRGS
jgi:hypothetical protein